MKTSEIYVDQLVQLSADFLRNTGQFTGEICFVVMQVKKIDKLGNGDNALITLRIIGYSPSYDLSFGQDWKGQEYKALASNLEQYKFKTVK